MQKDGGWSDFLQQNSADGTDPAEISEGEASPSWELGSSLAHFQSYLGKEL